MTPQPFSQLLIIAPPGRFRENLLAMAVSVMTPEAVRLADTCELAEEKFGACLPDLILVDFREPGNEMRAEIKRIQLKHPYALIVLLQYCLGQTPAFSEPRFREVVYGDISGELLTLLADEARSSRRDLRRP